MHHLSSDRQVSGDVYMECFLREGWMAIKSIERGETGRADAPDEIFMFSMFFMAKNVKKEK